MVNKEKSFYIKTFGCQMNEADSERLKATLLQEGYGISSAPENADVIILNTCSIRQKAEDKVYQYLNQWKGFKKDNPNRIFALGGCLGQEKGNELLRKFKCLDLVFGSESLLAVPKLLENVYKTKKRLVETGWDNENKILTAKIPWANNGRVAGLVPIIRGCNNFCSYCVVPYTRGRERSRPFLSVIEEVEDAVEKGIKEITLLGQNVNSYRDGEKDLSDLLVRLNKIQGLRRIRFMTSHPRDLDERFIGIVNECEKVCEHFHLPVQSASNRILASMNRGYTKEEYDSKIKAIRRIKPESSITTDIIVGFPGESGEDFKETLNYIERIEFDSAFTFIYSARPNTSAFNLKDSVSLEEKKERLQKIIKLQQDISGRKNDCLKGKEVEVLAEEICNKGNGKLFGRTRTGKSIVFNGSDDLIGEEVIVKINKTSPHTLEGKLSPV